MSKREDQGKNLLRMLQAAQPAPAPPDARQGHVDEVNSSEYPSPSYPVFATDVRSAAAGEQRYPDPASAAAPDRSSYLLPRPGASVTTPVRAAGANLLHQRSLQLARETAPLQQNRQRQHGQHQRQQQHSRGHQHTHHEAAQQGPASPPPPFTPRSSGIAAEQERFLKNFLAIGGDNANNQNKNDNDSNSDTGPPGSVPFSPPPTPPQRQQQTAVVPQTPPPPVATPPRRPPPVTPSAVAETTKPNGGRVRNSVSNQGKGGGGGRDGRGRGGRTPQQHGVSGGRESRKGRGKGGGGGGGRNGPAAPVSSSKYAWSAFQNSPDPKSIPIPSLRHFNLDVSPGEESAGPEVGLASLDWRESFKQPPQEATQGSGSGGVAAGYDASVAGGALSTPPPPAAAVARTDAAPSNGNSSRSSAKKAEEDIKRMLRLG